MNNLDPGILDLQAQVVFFPVRHHSPTCARLLRQLIEEMQPQIVLIEGPSDFNDRIAELTLPHQLPIAIYSFTLLQNGQRRGAFYPFCLYSPEWQAIQAAATKGSTLRFIDLPWSRVAAAPIPSHRYADGELRQSGYVASLCQQLGVETFDDVWDRLFEIDPQLTLTEYMERCHLFCFHVRLTDFQVPATDYQREAFMANQIRQATAESPGRILVVTGGFHSFALYAAVHDLEVGLPFLPAATPDHAPEDLDSIDVDAMTDSPGNAEVPQQWQEKAAGIALTPYSYERLDNLVGYESGMPGPGFYHHVWEDREAHQPDTYRKLLAQTARSLRKHKQVVSAADLIAVETTARGLALLRGHEQVWRQDLIDGITSALVKEEMAYGVLHPFLAAIYTVFRGDARGHLAEGTLLPPLVLDLRQHLQAWDLQPTSRERKVDLELTDRQDRSRSRVLHQLRLLGIPGFRRSGGTDLAAREDLVRIWEQWSILWTPEYEAGCIEAAIYGSTLADAAEAKLLELIRDIERNAELAALRLLDASLMGLSHLADSLFDQLTELIRSDSDFLTTTAALGHLLYLYRYDEVLGTTGDQQVGSLLVETFQRSLWLLESLGHLQGMDRDLLQRIHILVETWERCGVALSLDFEHFVDVLHRISVDPTQLPLMRGAAAGALWTLSAARSNEILAAMQYFADPDHLGDFLTGLFALAREAVQRHTDLVFSIDELILRYSDEEFLTALPALRLAFSYFTPREKHHLARTLVQARATESGIDPQDLSSLIPLEVSVDTAAQVLAFETRLFQAMQRYGVRDQ